MVSVAAPEDESRRDFIDARSRPGEAAMPLCDYSNVLLSILGKKFSIAHDSHTANRGGHQPPARTPGNRRA
jgi:hypothetical protein